MVYTKKKKRIKKKKKHTNKKYKTKLNKQTAGGIANSFVDVYDLTEGYVTKSFNNKKKYPKQNTEYDFFHNNFNDLL